MPKRTLSDLYLSKVFGKEVLVAGIDEVGRGCLAGPVTVAAVVLPRDIRIEGARDSKLLSCSKRRRLAIEIKRRALAIGIGWAQADEIDNRGLNGALQLAGRRALSQLRLDIDGILLDGRHDYLQSSISTVTLEKGDSRCLSVACASIIAKEARDSFMRHLHRLYPDYGFDSHVGYGTKLHLHALSRGLTPQHRRLFAPVRLAGES